MCAAEDLAENLNVSEKRKKNKCVYDNDHMRQTEWVRGKNRLKEGKKMENKQNQREENLFFNGTRARFVYWREKIDINALCVCALYEIQNSLRKKTWDKKKSTWKE